MSPSVQFGERRYSHGERINLNRNDDDEFHDFEAKSLTAKLEFDTCNGNDVAKCGESAGHFFDTPHLRKESPETRSRLANEDEKS